MTKFYLSFVFIFTVVLFSVNIALSQNKEKSTLNPPAWIQGTWTNSTESDSRKFQTVAFKTNNITLSLGLDASDKALQLNQKFAGFDVEETIAENFYQVEFNSKGYNYVYKFELSNDLYKTIPRTAGLYFSVAENKKVIKKYGRSKLGALLVRQ